jgi:hypothetical protein
MGALKASALAEDMGLRVGGTIRSEDVAATGQSDFDQNMQKLKLKDAPTGLDAYKAMQPQARMAQAPATQQGAAGATDDLTSQFRDIYQKAETPEEKLAIVRDAKKVGVPLSKFGEEMLTKAGEQAKPAEQVAPKIRPPMTVTGPDGKPQFTEEGKKYYESLGTSEQVANTVAESQGARLGRKLREQYRSMVGVMGTAAKNRRDIAAIEDEFTKSVGPAYEQKMRQTEPLEAEQARIKEDVRQDVWKDIAEEEKDRLMFRGLPKPATQFAKDKPEWVGQRPKITPKQFDETRDFSWPRIGQFINRNQSETGMADRKFANRQKAEAQRQLEIDRQIQEKRRQGLRPPTR